MTSITLGSNTDNGTMPVLNEKNAKRLINSYFDNPHTVHIGVGALGVVAFWIVGQLDLAFAAPPKWIFALVFIGVGGLSYGVDICVTSLIEWFS